MSNSNLRRSEMTSRAYSRNFQTYKSQLGTHDKVSYGGLEEVNYLPLVMDTKQKLDLKFNKQDQFTKRSNKDNLVGSNDLELKQTVDILKRELQAKDNKIRQLIVKSNHLYNKLKLFVSEQEINVEVEAMPDENEKKIKRLENLLRIKNEEVFFKIKVQASNLLEEFQLDKSEINGINSLENQNAIFEFLISKLKLRLKDFRTKQKESSQQLHKDKILQERHEETIHFLTETNEILKSSEARVKQKLEEMKNQWQAACEKLTNKERVLEQKQNQIFKLKKLYEQSKNSTLKSHANQRQFTTQIQQQKREAEGTIRELRSLLTNYNLEKKQLQTQLDEKDELIDEMTIREKFNQEEFEKVNREYVRWKERYEWLEKDKQTRIKQYQDELQSVLNEFNLYRSRYTAEGYEQLQNEVNELHRQLQYHKNTIRQYEQELNNQSQAMIQSEDTYYKKIENIETDYIKKSQSMEQLRQNQINQLTRLHQQAERQKIQELEQKHKSTVEQLQNQWKNKLRQSQNLYIEKFNQLNEQLSDHKTAIVELNQKISEKDKLITILYPSLSMNAMESKK